MQLTINNEKCGLIWGTRAFILAEKRLNMSLTEIMFGVTEDNVILNLAYCAIQNWYEDKDETNEVPFSFTQFCNWLDGQPKEIGDQITQSYLESNYQGKSMQERYDAANAAIDASNADNGVDLAAKGAGGKQRKKPKQPQI